MAPAQRRGCTHMACHLSRPKHLLPSLHGTGAELALDIEYAHSRSCQRMVMG